MLVRNCRAETFELACCISDDKCLGSLIGNIFAVPWCWLLPWLVDDSCFAIAAIAIQCYLLAF